jgi:hypothetical protein
MDQNYVGSLSIDLEQYWLVVKKTLKNDGVRQWGWDDIPCNGE